MSSTTQPPEINPQAALIRQATLDDLDQITEIYNYYIENTAITFDTKAWLSEERLPWFNQFATGSRYQCLVLVLEGRVRGYACSHQFRPKAAYDRSIETTVYLDQSVKGHGLGKDLYNKLLEILDQLDIHRIYGIITVPNDASIKLHTDMGYKQVGLFNEVGFKFNRYWDTVWMERKVGKSLPDNQEKTENNE